jgi:hypothetical protein
MFKFVGRFIVFLLVSCAIAAGLYWVVQRNPSVLGAVDTRRGFEVQRFSGENFQGSPVKQGNLDNGSRQNFPGRGLRDNERFGGGLALSVGFAGMLRNLGLIMLITIGVVCIQKLCALIVRKRSLQTA